MLALLGLLAGLGAAAPGGVWAEPRRVVSMNLCTDQLAMLVAAPGQLISVSYLARDARSSAMTQEAEAYPANSGLAEEVYLLDPDLVLTGRWSARATTGMLQRLGKRVEIFDGAQSFDDVRARILQMGAVLEQPDRARALVAAFDAELATLRSLPPARPRAALYFANGLTAGDNSLAGHILDAAGFLNIATEAGYGAGGALPLELLALSDPDAVITGQDYGATSRAEAVMDHPVIHALRKDRSGAAITDHDWMCGTPYVLRAITKVAALRAQIDAGQP